MRFSVVQRTVVLSDHWTDERQPACLRCRKATLVCEGYRGLPITYDRHVEAINQNHSTQGLAPEQDELDVDEDFVMVDRNPTSLAEPPSRNAARPHHNGITAAITRPPRGRPPKSKCLQPTSRATNVPRTRNPSAQSPLVPLEVPLEVPFEVPLEMSLGAFQPIMCVTFLVQNFLGHLDTGRKSLLPAWDVDNVSGTARDSVHALALAFFGKAHHQQSIVHQGAYCYGMALRKLRDDLNDPNAMWSSSVLLSSILLARYELVASTGSEGWIQHAGGVERLFELRGPWRHRNLEDRHIFEAARPIIVIKAITDCKRTFLDQEAWLTLPWAQDLCQKSSMNQLIDIFCIIPGLLEDSKSLHHSNSFVWDFTTPTSPSGDSIQDPRLVDLRQRTQKCYTKLQGWKADWDRTYPSAVQPVKMSYFPPSDLKFPIDIFEHAITFPSFVRANEYQLYNTVVFFLTSLMLSVPAPSADDRTLTPSVTDLLGQRWDAATDICRAVPYDLMFEKHGCGGAYLLLFPLLTNLRLFGADSPEGRWIRQVLAGIRNKWGLEGEGKYMVV